MQQKQLRCSYLKKPVVEKNNSSLVELSYVTVSNDSSLLDLWMFFSRFKLLESCDIFLVNFQHLYQDFIYKIRANSPPSIH